jgi:uncharacterized protein YyaL (SSP411 family)
VRAFGRELAARPAGFSSLLMALQACLEPPAMLLLRGEPAACRSWQRSVERRYRPSLWALNLSQQQQLPDALAKPHGTAAGTVTAWLCRGTVCLPPLQSFADLEAALGS